MRSNVMCEVVRHNELATVRTGHFGGSYAIMYFSYVLCNIVWLEFSIATARTSDTRDVHIARVVVQAHCARKHLPTPLYITHNSTHNHFL